MSSDEAQSATTPVIPLVYQSESPHDNPVPPPESARHAGVAFLALIAILGVVEHLLLLPALPVELRSLAALVITGLVPGALLVYWLVVQSEAPPGAVEFWLYAVGAGFAILAISTLCLSYLPGPLLGWQILLAADGLSLMLLASIWVRFRKSNRYTTSVTRIDAVPATRSIGWVVAGAAFLLLLGSLFRFGSLGYAEFLTDEAHVVLRSAAVLQGYDDVLFLHRKGPVEILLPTVEFSLAGQLTETTARLPFALASVGALLAVWLLGWRIFGGLAGWLAAFLLLFDGYLVGFAHFVQFQSIVFLAGVLTLLVLKRLEESPHGFPRYLILASLFFVVGMLSHYDFTLILFPASFLASVIVWRNRHQWRRLVRSALPAIAIAGALLALFYVPFLTHPHFQATYTYIVDRRIGLAGFPYNNLPDVMMRSSAYDSVYYLAALSVLLCLAIGVSYYRAWSGPRRRVLAVLVSMIAAGAMLVMLMYGDLLRIDDASWAVAIPVLLLGPLCIVPRLPAGWRMVWIWLTTSSLMALYVIEFPRTHVYTIAAPAALLAGMVLDITYVWGRNKIGVRWATGLGIGAIAATSMLFGVYTYAYFVYTGTGMLQTWPAAPLPLYWQPPGVTSVDALYGFPRSNGWKVAGVLSHQGALPGAYDSNQRYEFVSYWYMRGADRCFSEAQHYLVVDNIEPWVESADTAFDRVGDNGFSPWINVTVEGKPRMKILRATTATGVSVQQTLELADYADEFDRLATTDLPLDYPVVELPVTFAKPANFDNKIRLEGYSISPTGTLAAGDVIHLRLFWRAQTPLGESYKVFNQAYYGDGVMIAQQDSLPVCNRKPTNQWEPGELIVDDRTVPIANDAPPGDYPFYVGLYDEQTSRRLPVLDAAGNQVDDKIQLFDLHVAGP